jgi:hypothetical protein
LWLIFLLLHLFFFILAFFLVLWSLFIFL